jgi:hypothetical protein
MPNVKIPAEALRASIFPIESLKTAHILADDSNIKMK